MTSVWVRATAGLARAWVTLCTLGLGPSITERRRSEVESDVWETLHARGDAPSALAFMEVLDRLVRGVPADLAWWFEARRAVRAASPGSRTPESLFEAGPPSPLGRRAFQVFGAVVVATAVWRVTEQLLRVGDFKAAIPIESGAAIAVIVGIYCVPPLTALLACAVAAPLVLRAERLPEARSLALFLAFMALFWATVLSFFYFLPSSDPGQLNFGGSFGPGASAWAFTWCVLAIVAFLRFSALFPKPLDLDHPRAPLWPAPLRALQRLSTLPVFVWGVAALLILVMAAPAVGRPWEQGSPLDVEWSPFWILAAVRMLIGYLVVPILMMAVGVANLYSGLRTADGSDRARTLWLFAGFSTAFWMVAAAAVGFLVQDVLPLPFLVLEFQVLFAPLVIVVCVAFAVFYRGDLDPGLIIRRGTVYGAIGVLFIGVFAATEGLVSDLLVSRTGVPGAVGDALLAAIAALLMIPVRGRLTQWTAQLGGGHGGFVERSS